MKMVPYCISLFPQFSLELQVYSCFESYPWLMFISFFPLSPVILIFIHTGSLYFSTHLMLKNVMFSHALFQSHLGMYL